MLMVDAAITSDDMELPLVAYDQILTTGNTTASSEATGYAITRAINPATHLDWRGASAAITYITIVTDGITPLGYIGLVGHNFLAAGIQPSIEYLDSSSPPAWVQLEAPFAVTGDEPIMWQLNDPVHTQYRIKMSAGSIAPAVAVVMAGSLLIMQRRIYSQHVPVPYGYRTNIANGFSESGRFLGRVVLGETRISTAQFRFITPAWFRDNIPDFLEAAQEKPFLFVWRPDTYPEEVGYVVLTGDVTPMPQDPASNNMIAFDLAMEGVA